MGTSSDDVTAEIHGFSQPDAAPTPWSAGVIVFRVQPVRGLGFRKGDTFSQTTWLFTR